MQNDKWWPLQSIVRAVSDIKHFQSIKHIKKLPQVTFESFKENWRDFSTINSSLNSSIVRQQWRCDALNDWLHISPALCACSPAPRPPDSVTRPRWGREWPRCCHAQSLCSLPYSLCPLCPSPRLLSPYRVFVAREEDNTLYGGLLRDFFMLWNWMGLE